MRDVTQQREVDRMKSEFVSHVSHELRTPLTSIAGFIDLILEGEAGEIDENQHRYLSIVNNNANRLVDLINDLLDISRIEAGRIDLRCSTLDLGALVTTAATALRPQIDAHHQLLDLAVPDTLPNVWGDADRVLQILTNLLSNASKYTPDGGQLRIRAEPHEDMIAVSVSDTGVGMSPEELSRLFTRFYRVNNELTSEITGTGLGLAITRSLVEMHGGTITVSSTPGAGSVFTFTLPVTGDA
jgi:signal transduction histidine kinase